MEDRETYFEDLSPCLYFGEHFIGATGEKLKAVGWLAKGRPSSRRQTELQQASFHQLLSLCKIRGSPAISWDGTCASSVLRLLPSPQVKSR